MSATVAKALKLTGKEEVMETATFIEIVDKLFDTLNVSALSRAKLKCKPFVQPYRKSTDFRLKVCGLCHNAQLHTCSYSSIYIHILTVSAR